MITVRETAVEKYLRDEVKKLGGRAYKFVSPGNRGVPDRLVLLPGGHTLFVELKAPGKTSTDLQKKKQQDIRRLGFDVSVVDTKARVDEFVARCRGLLGQ